MIEMVTTDAYAASGGKKKAPIDAYAASAQDASIVVFKRTGTKYHTNSQCHIVMKHRSDGTAYTKCHVCENLDKKQT